MFYINLFRPSPNAFSTNVKMKKKPKQASKLQIEVSRLGGDPRRAELCWQVSEHQRRDSLSRIC